MPREQPLAVDYVQQDPPPPTLPNLPLLTSHQSSWQNIHLAHHRQPAWELPESYCPHHIVVIPIVDQPVDIEFRWEGRAQTEQVNASDYVQGCIEIFPANLSHSGRWRQAVEFIHFYLEPTYLAQIAYEAVNPDRVELLLELKKPDLLIHQIGLALRASLEMDRVGNRFYADSLATALSAHLLHHYTTRQHRLPGYDEGLSRQKLRLAIDYIQANLGENLSLTEMANQLGMSQYYFCRLFKQSTGVSPHQFLIQQRVERAQQLLIKHPELTVTAIAMRCGFSSQSHLAKHFRKHTGLNPNQFRR
jgi:AraC family transcriptional regulator